ncbi:uncharacterized protein LOC126770734 [Nymphalis io]|uniref:uncharacterized protein LOC126770734 n=1 Tax=Inachis io TaxID=171585 RepID=UPI002169BD1B|nr:uncharacterized protein LOC126770734 [Nymphalis io]
MLKIKNLILHLKITRNTSCATCTRCNYSLHHNAKFTGEKDRFNGITVDSTRLQCKKETFSEILDESLKSWIIEGRRCIWFKININDSAYVPMLAQKGFNFHHARDDFVMMYKWLPTDSEPNLPPACHTNLGVGALVLNRRNQLLAVSEKHYDYPHWKLPGGYVERGEDIVKAAQREVKEETGVDSEFLSLITFRHTHNMMFGNSDIYILLMMTALSEKITLSLREVKDCKWMNIEEYTNHPHVHEFNKLVINQALLYKNGNLKLDIQRKTVKWSQFTREMSYLIVNNYDNK